MGEALSSATRLNQAGNPVPKEKLRRIPPGDFLQGAFLVEITLIFYSLPADFQQVFTATHRSGQGSLRMG